MALTIGPGQTVTGTGTVGPNGGSPNISVDGVSNSVPFPVTPSSFSVNQSGWTFTVYGYTSSRGASYNWLIAVPATATPGSYTAEFADGYSNGNSFTFSVPSSVAAGLLGCPFCSATGLPYGS